MFTRKELQTSRRRSFQIVIGLMEGYDLNVRRTAEEVKGFIKSWMTKRLTDELPCLTGGTLVPGTLLYAWSSQATGIRANEEDTLLFMGEVNPLYSAGLTDDQVIEALISLASFLGEQLNQTRMYVTYLDQVIILQNDRQAHPTGG